MIKLDTYWLEKLDIYGRHYSLLQGMSMDKKIQLYIARDFLKYLSEYQAVSDDKIEVGKDYPGIEEERELAYKDIDKAFVLCLENNYKKLVNEGKNIHPTILKILKKKS